MYCLNIRPELVRNGAKFLAQKPLYTEHIAFDNTWGVTDDDTVLDKNLGDSENADDHINTTCDVTEEKQQETKNTKADTLPYADESELGQDIINQTEKLPNITGVVGWCDGAG